MKLKPKQSIAEHFGQISDPRIERRKQHQLIDIITIGICAVVCGIVTMDAMGCQTEIVKRIVEKEADYAIALKKNQGNLFKQVEEIFKEAIASGVARKEGEKNQTKALEGERYSISNYQTREWNRGREEIRNYLMISQVADRIDPRGKWKKLNSIFSINSSFCIPRSDV
jgi:predicted transposase YbfD/YdcC